MEPLYCVSAQEGGTEGSRTLRWCDRVLVIGFLNSLNAHRSSNPTWFRKKLLKNWKLLEMHRRRIVRFWQDITELILVAEVQCELEVDGHSLHSSETIAIERAEDDPHGARDVIEPMT